MKATTSGARASRALKKARAESRTAPGSVFSRARQAVAGLVSKRDFILSMPAATAKEVVQAAKKQRISITPAYVYMVRSRAGARAAPRAQASADRQLTLRKGPPPSKRGIEQVFVSRALEIGIVRARELLAEVRNQTSAA